MIVIKEALVVGMDNDHVDEISFTIKGSPPSQNGWKLAWKHLSRRPVIYNPNRTLKTRVKIAIRSAVTELTGRVLFPIFVQETIVMNVVFCMHNVDAKDLDNMVKFLGDALQGAIYDNDKYTRTVTMTKVAIPVDEPESTVVRIASTTAGIPFVFV